MSQQPDVAKTQTPSASQLPPRPYRRFIIPSMHRRFTNAALLSLCVCLIQSLWMGGFTSLWQIFVVTSIRSMLLFISILAIYILRVANMHVGKRITPSEFQTFYQYFLSLDTFRALLWYLFSAFFFCEVYMWSAPKNSNLAIIDPGKSYEHPRLNERPIFLRSMFLCLAAAQTFIHLYRDYDRALVPGLKNDVDIETLKNKSQRAFWAPIGNIRQRLFLIARQSFFRVFVATLASPIAYWFFIRQTAWSWTFWIAKHAFTFRKASKAPTFPPLIVDLLGRFVVNGFLLMFAWEFANAAFDEYLSQEPLKQGHLLTDESNDPNGTLLNGLKVKRPVPRSFAFRELVMIAQNMPQRRATVYSEISRQGGSTWSQLLTICLGEVHAIVIRIQDSQPDAAANSSPQLGHPQHTLPKIAAPMKQDNVLRTPPKPTKNSPVESDMDRFITSSAQKAITYATDATLSKEHQRNLSKDSVRTAFQSAAVTLLQYPCGAPFRQTFARQVSSAILGTPRSNLSVILDSIRAVTKFVNFSLKEDNFGTVYRDVPNIIRTFTSSYNTIENFLQKSDVHWTDVNFKEGSAASGRKVEDVELLLKALRDGLTDMVNEFGEYSDSMGLSPAELRAAKEVAAKGASSERVKVVS